MEPVKFGWKIDVLVVTNLELVARILIIFGVSVIGMRVSSFFVSFEEREKLEIS